MKIFLTYLVAFVGGGLIGYTFGLNGFTILTWQYWVGAIPLSILWGIAIGYICYKK